MTLGFKPEQTAQLAQRLFEEGLITYHRTDSQNFSAEALAEIRAYAASNKLPLPSKPRTWKSKESAQEAHEAIRPTHLEQRHAGADNDQKNLYDLIWTRAVASQLADAEYSVNTLTLAAQHGSQPFVFKATGRTLVKPGWRTLTAKDAAEEPEANETEDPEKQSDENGRVPSLPRGAQLRADAARVLNKQTRPPNGYTQASLIKKLEHEGIGRPSTYPAILKNIITRNYIDDSKKLLRATALGILLIDSLKGHFAFLEYDYTRSLEQQLDDIAEGKAQYINVVSGIDGQLKKELAQLHIAPHPVSGVEWVSTGEDRKCPAVRIVRVPEMQARHRQKAQWTELLRLQPLSRRLQLQSQRNHCEEDPHPEANRGALHQEQDRGAQGLHFQTGQALRGVLDFRRRDRLESSILLSFHQVIVEV